MRTIFLDVDGVLNTDIAVGGTALRRDLTTRFVEQVLALDADVVVSSTWRLHPFLRNQLATQLREYGLPSMRVTGQTKELTFDSSIDTTEQRAIEILTYVCDHHLSTSESTWVAIDDLDLLQTTHGQNFAGHFVQTNPTEGFTLECAHLLSRLFQE
ncbi:Aste57867_13469 [Aphanomyces stellatus]|uniref:Aste57867_13469 protein n=1 Tax=Aphanomyces stellatus TaxID=120398 RepID=A0A485L097_9STRA|nr:hypothetical protein As57867_013419 [Aphanomyces stellatus]VFT90307.1 Aste57867_13469 [Aphanomyces stellatus]